MQYQQNTNKNNPSSPSHQQKNYRLLKCKNKPFWLNLSQNKSNNYDKYKLQQNPQAQPVLTNEKKQLNLNEQNPQLFQERQSCLESIESLNDKYTSDFQSYQSTTKQLNQSQIKNNQSSKISLSSSKFEIKLIQLDSKFLKTPKRKQNFTSLSQIDASKTKKPQFQKRIKTQLSQLKKNSSIQKEIYMNENSKYLQQQNQKILEMIKQMRKLLPIIKKNQQQITIQQWEIKSLKLNIQKATSIIYGLQLEKNKSELQSNKKIIEKKVKLLNLPIKVHLRKFITEHSTQLSLQEKVRQQLLCKLRILALKDEKSFQLDKKLNLYQEMIQNIDRKAKMKCHSSLERRKIFLQWDVQRMKNQFDLKILQQNIQINQLKEQIQLLQMKSLQLQKLQEPTNSHNVSNAQKLTIQTLQKKLVQTVQNQISIQEKQTKSTQINHSKFQNLPFLLSPKKQSNTFKYKQFSTQNQQENKKTIFHRKLEREKHNLSYNQKTLPQIKQQKNAELSKTQSANKMNQKLIRIKKFSFKHADLNEDLEELIL